MSQKLQEENTFFLAEQKTVVDKKMEVFYNPVMKLNRDFSLLIIKNLDFEMIIGDPLAGSGIRSLRLLIETPKNIKKILVNDLKKDFKKNFEENLALNNLEPDKFEIYNEDANNFMNKYKFDYLDIDPFGSPNPFLDSAVRSIKRKGILAVTATDTSALCGSYPSACRRKYWANPLRDENMHETGLRILIRKVQLIGLQYDKALIPLISYSKDHYMRIFFLVDVGKTKVDEILKKHETVQKKNVFVGPLWTGDLNDSDFLKKIKEDKFLDNKKELKKLVDALYQESLINSLFFVDVHKTAKSLKSEVPNMTLLMNSLKEKNYLVCRTHFSVTGLKTNASYDEFLTIFKSLIKK